MTRFVSAVVVALSTTWLFATTNVAAAGEVSATPPPPSPERACWDNTTEIYLNLAKQEPFASSTFILCPHSVFTIGYSVNGECCKDGDLPLIPRANTHFKCGEDGKSSNNCTLVGGTLQIMIDQIVFQEPTVNIIMEGITFQNAGNYVSLPSSEGDFTFKDCIFQDHHVLGLFVMLHYPHPTGGRRRRLLERKEALMGSDPMTKIDVLTSEEYLQEILETTEEYWTGEHLNDYMSEEEEEEEEIDGMEESEEEIHYAAEAAADPDSASGPAGGQRKYSSLIGNWQGCIFRNNRQGPTNGFTTHGILTSMEPRNLMNFDRCLFEDNDYGSVSGLSEGYAIKSDSSPLSITNTCFMDNKFGGLGAVQALNGTAVEYQNVYGTVDDEGSLQCPFVALQLPGALGISGDTSSSSSSDVHCLEYDASKCELSFYQPASTTKG